MKKLKKIKIPLTAALFFTILSCAGYDKNEPFDPKSVLAKDKDGDITYEQMENYLLDMEKEAYHPQGENNETSFIDQILNDNEDAYVYYLKQISLERIIPAKVKEKQLDEKDNVKHALEHLSEEVTLEGLDSVRHKNKEIPVSESEVEKYYEENRANFNKPLYDERDNIRKMLEVQKENDYVRDYINQLKSKAVITKYFEIMDAGTPSEEEMNGYYNKNLDQYEQQEQWLLDVVAIKGSNTGESEKTAQKAWNLLGSGGSLDDVKNQFDTDKTLETIAYVPVNKRKGGNEEFAYMDEALKNVYEGGFSRPFLHGDQYKIAYFKSIIPASHLSFESVRETIRDKLQTERDTKQFENNKSKTLFTIDGRRYAYDEIYGELKEYSRNNPEMYRSYEAKVGLIEQLIERLLLLDQGYDRLLDVKGKERIDLYKQEILQAELHKDEIDKKIVMSDENLLKFYEQRKKEYTIPKRHKISLIVASFGDNEEEKAKKKIEDAYKKIKDAGKDTATGFDQAAKEYSEDPYSASRGGQIDEWISETKNTLYEAYYHKFHEQIAKLRIGQYTRPFKVDNAYFVIMLRESENEKPLPFDEIKERIRMDYEGFMHKELTEKYTSALLNEAKFNLNRDNIKKTIAIKKYKRNTNTEIKIEAEGGTNK